MTTTVRCTAKNATDAGTGGGDGSSMGADGYDPGAVDMSGGNTTATELEMPSGGDDKGGDDDSEAAFKDLMKVFEDHPDLMKGLKKDMPDFDKMSGDDEDFPDFPEGTDPPAPEGGNATATGSDVPAVTPTEGDASGTTAGGDATAPGTPALFLKN